MTQPPAVCFDTTMAGFLVNSVIEMKGQELLPDLQDLFATNLVDIGACGTWESVKADLSNPAYPAYSENCYLDIHERFEQLKKMFN